LVVKRKEHFWSLDETEEKAKPKLRLQIWENDTFSSDDFIGTHWRAENLFVLVELFMCTTCCTLQVTKHKQSALYFLAGK